MKLVIHAEFGGFHLSEAQIRRYAEIKGIGLWVELSEPNKWYQVFWTKPPEERPTRPGDGSNEAWYASPIADRLAYNEAYQAATLRDDDIPRDDSALVQAVEEYPAENDDLAVVEIPDGTDWYIEEFDGKEYIGEGRRWYGE